MAVFRDEPGADKVPVALATMLGVPLLTTEKAFKEAADFAAIDLIR